MKLFLVLLALWLRTLSAKSSITSTSLSCFCLAATVTLNRVIVEVGEESVKSMVA